MSMAANVVPGWYGACAIHAAERDDAHPESMSTEPPSRAFRRPPSDARGAQ